MNDDNGVDQNKRSRLERNGMDIFLGYISEITRVTHIGKCHDNTNQYKFHNRKFHVCSIHPVSAHVKAMYAQ